MRHGFVRLIVLMLVTLLVIGPPAASAGASDEQVKGIEALVDLLRQKKVISPEEASGILTRIGGRTEEARGPRVVIEKVDEQAPVLVESAGQPAAKSTAQAAPPAKEAEAAAVSASAARPAEVEATRKVSFASEWSERIRWGGDIRLRYQADLYGDDNAVGVGNPANPSQQLNTTEDRHQARIRARLLVEAKVNDHVDAGVRLAGGSSNSPVSTNETLGDHFAKDDVWIDQAYLKIKPVDDLVIWGGRHPNPFFSTDLLWDNDLNFEGGALQYKTKLTRTVRPFAALGGFAVQEVELSDQDKWLLAGQIGAEVDITRLVQAKAALSYYDYRNIVGQRNTLENPGLNDFTAPQFQQKGNTLMDIDPTAGERFALASDFQLVNLTGQLDIGFWDPVRIVLFADYVRNIGFDTEKVRERTLLDEVSKEIDGYQFGLLVGHRSIKDFGQWRAGLTYRYLESDAVVDAFTDSDFHGGGTNAQGWILRGEFGLWRNVWLALQWMTADEISGLPFALDTLQVDLNARF
jgi:hypothetical protein